MSRAGKRQARGSPTPEEMEDDEPDDEPQVVVCAANSKTRRTGPGQSLAPGITYKDVNHADPTKKQRQKPGFSHTPYDEHVATILNDGEFKKAAPLLDKVRADGEPKMIVMYNNKGGVLKSTSVSEVGFMLSEFGFNVLLVDLDSQGSLTKSLLPLEDPEEDVTFRKRVRVNGQPLPECMEDDTPIRYELFEGITQISRPNAADASPEQLTAIELRAAGPVQDERPAQDLTGTKKKRWQDCINSTRPASAGSVHLIIGHHETMQINYLICEACNMLFGPVKDGKKDILHGSIDWLMRDVARRTKCDLILVDLNPDAGHLNRTVIMQSDYVLMPTWPDKDGIECCVDIKSRLVRRLLYSSAELPQGAVYPHYEENINAWVQFHYDTIKRLDQRITDTKLRTFLVQKRWPKFIGILIHSKESRQMIDDTYQIGVAGQIVGKFSNMTRCLLGKALPGERNCQFAISHGGQRILTLLTNIREGGGIMAVDNDLAVVDHGGMRNIQELKTKSKFRHKVMSRLNADDVADGGAVGPTNIKTQVGQLQQIIGHRVRMFGICRSILHNISLDLVGEGILPPPT